MDNIHEFTSQHDLEEQAADWLARLDSDVPLAGAEREELKEWLQRSPAHEQALKSVTQYWDQCNDLTELSFPLYRQHLQAEATGFMAWLNGVTRNSVWQGLGTASMVLVLVMGGSLWLGGLNQGVLPSVSGNGVYETRIGERNTITLLDGSVIELNTNSRVQVNYDDTRRAVALMQGEAHFEVSKDPERPFEVGAGGGLVRAIGTAFVVRLKQEALQVTVTEGKVALGAVQSPVPESLTPKVLQQGVLSESVGQQVLSEGMPLEQSPPASLGALVAGQSVEFEPGKTRSVADVIHNHDDAAMEKLLAWREGLLMFSGEPLWFVAQEISRYTPLTIEITDPDIAGLSIGGQFKVGETESMLKHLAVSFDLEILRTGDNVIQLVKK